ncbi:alpha-amylase family glycosyl hydrolase [Reichenbachiella ulvae]|uniref:Alpha-amylase family glycosyl hydrolase n=1 Tax=Reichenbachiella ulvae TaxID=2980104 RepID=A0ABT3CS46_9BACT|nr:alpha-amylase family glycosyl hydrolase [Reichenbachiella ulvae]MCV9386530.1 alpha-amylase family glycosyl hydrolase [Reichenbachiella ulvae]
MRKLILICVSLLAYVQLNAQKVDIAPTITPEFFQADEEITISYDATGNSLSNLDEAWIWLWLPDNENTNVVSNVNPASSNTSATDKAKFTKETNGGKVTFTITLTLTDFTGLSKDAINEVGMLLKGDDWADGQTEDYITQVTNQFTVQMNSPEGDYGFYQIGDVINLDIKTSEGSTIEIYVDDNLIASATDALSLQHNHTVIDDGEVHVLKAMAATATETDETTYTYSLTPNTPTVALPNGMLNGVNYNDANATEATLVLLAPGKNSVFVLGDFNDWQLDKEYLMNKDGDQFWVTISNLAPGTSYVFQYLIDGELIVADPYTEQVSDPWDDSFIDASTFPNLVEYPSNKTSYRASVLETGQTAYSWVNETFDAPDQDDLMIYELLVRDFHESHTYQAVIDKLDYLEGLGINAIELMPVNEFEGNESWGYNPNFYFAPDKYYGTKNDLKKLIDECHGRGIAVILDLVLNHTFNSSPFARMYWNDVSNRPAADNPWYNEQHNFANTAAHWGSDLNHESVYTQALVDSVNSYWMQEYKVDGFRFDFTKGFGNNFKSSSDEWASNYDADRIALLKRMADKIWEQDAEAYVIFEHLAENSEEKELADYGIMLWGNMNHDYRSLAKRFIKDISGSYHGTRGWSRPNLVSYMESHDEERVMWDIQKSTNMGLPEAIRRLQLNAVFFFTIPGPKMVWQFGEMAYDEELNNDRLGVKPTHWEYLEDNNRRKLYLLYQSLINLRSNTQYVDADYFEWESAGKQKWISISHPDVNIVVVGNFGLESTEINPHFTKDGTWYDYLTGQEIEVKDFENFELTVPAEDFRIFTSSVIENYIEESALVLGVNEGIIEGNSNWVLYPNPVKEWLTIETEILMSGISVFNMMGKVVMEQELFEKTRKTSMEVSSLEAGIYLIRLSDAQGEVRVMRFIKN